MKEWIIRLLCSHVWTLEMKRDVLDGFGGQYTSYTYICEKCGKFKRWKSS